MATILRFRFWNYCFAFIVISTRIKCDFASEEEESPNPTSFYHQKTAVGPPPASRPKIKFIPNDDFDMYDYFDVDLYYLIPVDKNKKPPAWNRVPITAPVSHHHHEAQNSQTQPCDHGTHSNNQVEKPVIFPSHLTYSYDYYEDPDPPGWPAPAPPPAPPPTPGWSWPAPATPGWSWTEPVTPGWSWTEPVTPGWPAPAAAPGWPAPQPPGWGWAAEPEPEKVKEKSKSKNKGKAKDKSKAKAKEKAKEEKAKAKEEKEKEKGEKYKEKEVEVKEKIKYVYVKEKEEKGKDKDKDKDKGDKGEKDKHKDKDKDKKEKSKPKKKFASFMKDVWNKFVDVLKFEKYADFDVTGERRLRSEENGKNDTEKGQNVLDTLYIPVSIALRWASAYPKVANDTE